MPVEQPAVGRVLVQKHVEQGRRVFSGAFAIEFADGIDFGVTRLIPHFLDDLQNLEMLKRPEHSLGFKLCEDRGHGVAHVEM